MVPGGESLVASVELPRSPWAKQMNLEATF